MVNGTMAAIRKLAASALVVGAMGSISVGTFATFTAQASNPTSGFQAGTIVLSNTKQGGSSCLSTGAGTSTDTNANGSCDTLFSLTARKPGDSATANLTLKNEGSLGATTLKLFAGSGCTGADATGETYHGTGDPCSKLQLYVQEYSDSGFTTPSACRYGGSSDGGTTCDFSDTAKTVAAFASAHSSGGAALVLPGGLTSGTSRYVRVGIKLDPNADNSYQGRKATAGLDWLLEQ
jgi:hypothetical protein